MINGSVVKRICHSDSRVQFLTTTLISSQPPITLSLGDLISPVISLGIFTHVTNTRIKIHISRNKTTSFFKFLKLAEN